ncbi:helix-turn-helix domain-containing protein [Microbacterium azadirachtae]|uniref:helix-turn-helix domain-containing protein n=1 Tax=Microbacterium azadirachtae TaxID=582680 RepID=UPI003F754E8A
MIGRGNAATVLGRLGGEWSRPIATATFRRVLTTHHVFEAGSRLAWPAQTAPDDSDAVAGMLFSQRPLRLVGRDRGGEARAVFLHPRHPIQLSATAATGVMAVWLPWSSVREIEPAIRPATRLKTTSPLIRAAWSFLSSLLTEESDPTLYSDYLVERLLAEMVFGVLVETAPAPLPGPNDTTMIARARTLMLMNRSDPSFTVQAVSQALHLSLRQLQRVFAASGSSPAAELRMLRVDLASELIRDEDYAGLGLLDIALHAGFRNSSGMRRAFAAAGLSTPGKMRAETTHSR